MFELGGLLTAGAGIVGSILGSREQAKQRRRMMKLIQQIMLEQRRNLAEAKQRLQIGKQDWMNNPLRSDLLGKYQEMARKGGPFTPDVVSAMKSQAAGQMGAQGALAMSQLRERLAKGGISGSGMAMAAENQLQRMQANDAASSATKIDIDTKQAQEDYRRRALEAYQGLVMGDMKQQYGFEEDYASLLGSVNYGNSLSAVGG